MERRTFLSAGSVSALAVATRFNVPSTGPRGDDPTDVVRDYYRRARAADTYEGFAAEMPELAHSVSPLSDLAESTPSVFDGALRLELVAVDVVEEDIGAEAIRDISDFLAGSVTDEELAALADTNAVVAVTLESDDVLGGELAKEWLVAPDGGEWRLVWVDRRNSPRAAAREFFREVKQTEFLGQLDDPVAELTYPSSPLGNIAEYTPWYFRGIRRRELVGTEVVAEDIGVGEIASKFDPVTNWPSETGIGNVADENAVVAVSLRDDQLDVDEFEQKWLVAPANGEWRVAWF